MWRDPALPAAELTWRWCFGFAAWLLAILSAGLFLDSLIVSPADQLLLRILRPVLLVRAVQHIFRGSLLPLVWIQAVLVVGGILLWGFAATAGRAATLHRIIGMFGEEDDAAPLTWQFGPILVINLMRAAWSLTALGAATGSLALGMALMHQERAAWAAFFFVFGITLSCVFGFLLNWFLGLVPLLCTYNKLSARDAVMRTLEFCTERGGRLLAISLGFLALRIIWAGTMVLFFLWPLKLSGVVAPGWVMLLMLTVTLVYFAGADLLYLARLGAYAALAIQGEGNDVAVAARGEPGAASGPGVRAFPPDLEPA